MPGEPGWFGPTWARDDLGNVVPELEITPLPGADLWLEVRVIGTDLDLGWTEGPLQASDVAFSVPMLVDVVAGAGLVQVIAILEATDPVTGELRASTASPPVYLDADASDTWFDTDAARDAIGLTASEDAAISADGEDATFDENLVGRVVGVAVRR